MSPEDFIDFVRQAFLPLAERHGLVELAVPSDKYVLKAIVFSSKRKAIQFYLDVRDGYLDALYSDASVYKPDGSLADPAIESVTRRKSVGALLKPEGVDWPTREGGLFNPDVLEKAVRDVIKGIERHSKEIFDQAV